MMKLLSIVALTGGVTTVTAATTTTDNENTKQQQQQLVGSSITPNRKLDTITTHQLQKDTNQFVQDNLNSIRFIHSSNTDEDTINNEVVQDDEERNNRALRSRKFRQKKKQFGGVNWHSPSWDEWGSEWADSGKSGKSGGSAPWGKKWSGKSDKNWHASWDDVGWHSDSWSGSRSGKGGFLSRDKWDDKWDNSGGGWSHSRSWDFDFQGRDEWFYMLPTACPNDCVSSHLSGNYEFIDSIKECREYEETQLWGVVSDGSYIMIESYDQKGKCIAVDYDSGDSDLMVAKTCFNGELVLKDCDTDYGTEWYFTGGQLVNSFCWAAGLSSVMTVFFKEGSKKLVKECENDLAVWGGSEDPLLKADTFMFVNSLPETPVHIPDVHDILDGKVPKGGGSQ